MNKTLIRVILSTSVFGKHLRRYFQIYFRRMLCKLGLRGQDPCSTNKTSFLFTHEWLHAWILFKEYWFAPPKRVYLFAVKVWNFFTNWPETILFKRDIDLGWRRSSTASKTFLHREFANPQPLFYLLSFPKQTKEVCERKSFSSLEGSNFFINIIYV